VDELPDLTITVCHQGACASGTPVVNKPPCAAGVKCSAPTAQCKLSGALDTICALGIADGAASSGTPQGITLDVDFLLDKAQLADGDVYTVRVVGRGTSAPLVDLTKTATYSTFYPNGKDCDGESGACKSASLK
jgi:hypothetical protein